MLVKIRTWYESCARKTARAKLARAAVHLAGGTASAQPPTLMPLPPVPSIITLPVNLPFV
jgi:hypothetical protein